MSIYPLLTIEQAIAQHSGRRVFVYISNSEGRWAIEDYDTRKVIFNVNYLTLRDVTTYVDEAKRLTCVKHVRLTHAYVVGTIASIDNTEPMVRIDYDPHSRDCFFYVDTKDEFLYADFAYCGERSVFVTL